MQRLMSCFSGRKGFLNLSAFILITGLTLAGCGKGELGKATTVKGLITGPDNQPIKGATLYIAEAPISAKSGSKSLTADCGAQGGTVTCEDPTETNCARTCSCQNGSYTLNTAFCPEKSDELKIIYAGVSSSVDLDCPEDKTVCEIDVKWEKKKAEKTEKKKAEPKQQPKGKKQPDGKHKYLESVEQ